MIISSRWVTENNMAATAAVDGSLDSATVY